MWTRSKPCPQREYAGRVPVGDEVRPGPQLPGRKTGVNRPSSGHHCHSSTVEAYICYILRAIFLGIHRYFIAHCYRRVCPAVALCTASPAMRSPGSSCRASSAVKLVTSYPCMGVCFRNARWLKDVQAKTTRRGPGGARPARSLPPSTGASAPHVLRGSPAHRGKRQRTRSYAADLGPSPGPLPLGVGPLPLTFSRRVLSAFSL